MKKTIIWLIILASIVVSAITGCTVVTANRVFPKLTWYWSKDAKMQRESDAEEKAYSNSLKTNKLHSESIHIDTTNELVLKVQKRDGTNFLGVYMCMIAEWDGCTSRYHPPTNYIGGPTGLSFADEGWMEQNAHPQGVMMFSATSGQMLKWISYEDFKAIFVDKTRPEYP